MERKAEMHAQICSELHELYEAKNADYGDAFSRTFDEYGMVAPLLRLEDGEVTHWMPMPYLPMEEEK